MEPKLHYWPNIKKGKTEKLRREYQVQMSNRFLQHVTNPYHLVAQLSN